eukprot:TRINITY_DN11673_c0_g1_i2.p1 TRINITY_DN11673_c0_g1~~TRINITY_DN11673_c0_g1_i2.p1  ORF type:complete len:375 (+),score=83.11 TRINITY_DN11673_c0_g1_i2:278-1402(+)
MKENTHTAPPGKGKYGMQYCEEKLSKDYTVPPLQQFHDSRQLLHYLYKKLTDQDGESETHICDNARKACAYTRQVANCIKDDVMEVSEEGDWTADHEEVFKEVMGCKVIKWDITHAVSKDKCATELKLQKLLYLHKGVKEIQVVSDVEVTSLGKGFMAGMDRKSEANDVNVTVSFCDKIKPEVIGSYFMCETPVCKIESEGFFHKTTEINTSFLMYTKFVSFNYSFPLLQSIGYQFLAQCKCLETVNISVLNVSDVGGACLAGCPSLCKVTIKFDNVLTVQERFCCGARSLKTVELTASKPSKIATPEFFLHDTPANVEVKVNFLSEPKALRENTPAKTTNPLASRRKNEANASSESSEPPLKPPIYKRLCCLR